MGNSLDKSEDWRNNSKSNINKKSARQTYRPDSVDRLAPAGNHSSGHPIAEMLKPPTRMLERAALRGRNRTHAYLVLLRVEVAAFHPAMSNPRERAHHHGNTVAECVRKHTLTADSSLWP